MCFGRNPEISSNLKLDRLKRSFPVNLDIFFAAAMRDGDHDSDANQNRDTNQCPGGADVLRDT
jgi:hypothetical protein